MTAFLQKVASLTNVSPAGIERLSGGDLSEVLLVSRPDGRRLVAKGGPAVATEAAMLRALAGAGMPAPTVEGEHESILLLEYVENDAIFSSRAWEDIGGRLRALHCHLGEDYGWAVDYALGSVALDNRQGSDWPRFWFEQRIVPTAALLDRPWRERIDRLGGGISRLIAHAPPASLLHGDLWSGNILVSGGRLAALIDPACCRGDPEVDLAMLTLFDAPPPNFWSAYGDLEPGWEERRPAYQLFPALVHLRLFGQSYAGLADRLLTALGV